MASKEKERVLLLEGEVKSLTEELLQCQADKEFVWSLWKRLQVASPDMTQAVSLVVEREKQKAEMKDRKVLEILQAKDSKIQALELELTAQRKLLGDLTQHQRSSKEEHGMMKKELADLQSKLSNKTRQLQELQSRDEEWGRVQANQEEARRGLEERCNALQGALHQAEEQQEESRRQETLNTTRVKELQEEVVRTRTELMEALGRCSALSAQLNAVEQQASEREQQLQQIGRELQELQGLYRQSVQHAGEQAELIQQLEGLNLDTQQVLHSQEQAISTHTASYQQLYTELSVSYQALRCSEENLRQRETVLNTQLHQRDQHISQLQDEVQSLRERVCQAEAACLQAPPPQPQAPPPQPQLFEQVPRQAEEQQQYGDDLEQQAMAALCVPQNEDVAMGCQPGAHPLSSSDTQGFGAAQHFQQYSRSLSPDSRGVAERLQQLEELLVLKTEENEELRRAHAKRHDRLRLIQTNYRAVKQQLREVEDLQGVIQLEEELDVARVEAAVDRATAHELRVCLREEQQELQRREAEEEQVMKVSTRVLPAARRLEQAVEKIGVLERKMVCLERETAQLQEDNQALQDANNLLSQDRNDLQAALKRATAREEAAQAQANAERERFLDEAQALEAKVQSSRREVGEALGAETQAKRTMLRLRQELGVLRADRDFHRALTRRWGKVQLTSSRARLPAARPSQAPARSDQRRRHTYSNQRRTHTRSDQRRTHTRSDQRRTHTLSEDRRIHSPTKDEWEDVSPDSESENFSDSLESQPSTQNPLGSFKPKGCRRVLNAPHNVRDSTAALPWDSTSMDTARPDLKKRNRNKSQHSCAILRQRLLCLQQQVAVLQSANRAAQEQSEKHSQTQTELESLGHKLQASKQLSQKQAFELVKLQQQVSLLEAELEHWKKPHPPATPPTPDSNHPTLKILEGDIKQLTSKLKSASVEGSRQSTVIKDLRAELRDRDQRLKELQDKVSHTERNVVMKRQLVEDLRNRLKVLQDSEHSHRSLTDDLEKKVKSLSEEAANRKAFIESLRRRLNVAVEEKNQHESTSQKLREDLQKKDEKLVALQVRLGECERSQVEVERTACTKLQAVTQQSSDALQTLHNKLTLVQAQEKQLRSLTQALAVELARDVQETRQKLRKRKGERKKLDRALSNVSKSSMVKAKCIAASILNLSEGDLDGMLDTDEEEECSEGTEQNWVDQIRQILQQQVPSAGLLLEAMLVKMKEWRVLTGELAVLNPTVSEID